MFAFAHAGSCGNPPGMMCAISSDPLCGTKTSFVSFSRLDPTSVTKLKSSPLL